MALVPCPECGKPVAQNAPTCPNCGAAHPARIDTLDADDIVGLILGALSILGILYAFLRGG